jgi:putative flippase GtrA
MKRELIVFLVVGTLTVLIDLAVYHTLLALALPIAAAKAIGFVAGTIFAYFLNKIWTFTSQGTIGAEGWRFVLLYGTTLLAHVGLNSLTLMALPEARASFHFAFILATGVSASLNFLGMKFFVFVPRTGGAS